MRLVARLPSSIVDEKLRIVDEVLFFGLQMVCSDFAFDEAVADEFRVDLMT